MPLVIVLPGICAAILFPVLDKSDQAYKTIGEVVKILNDDNRFNQKIATHTIRFWEKQFKQIKHKILSGNKRYYDKSNIDLLKKITFLLKDQGMTIIGVKKILNSKQTNNLDEISNKFIKADNLKNKISNISEIIKGDVIFCATGVTSGDLTKGVQDLGNEYEVTTFVLHKSKKINKIITNIYNK